MKRYLKTALAVLGAATVFIFAVIGFLDTTRGTPVRQVIALGDPSGPPATGDSLFARTMELFAGTHLDDGNRVELFTNGNETYPRLWQDLRAARQTITVQMYYSQPGAVADTMGKVLAEMARKKVRVLLVLDAFGSQ